MKDRRKFERLRCDNRTLLFYDNREIEAEIIDISAYGARFKVPGQEELPEVGDEILFQYVDDIKIIDTERSFVVSGEATISHMEKDPSGVCIGCYINNPEHRKYVEIKEFIKAVGD